MNHRTVAGFRESLIKQLVYFDENSFLLLNTIPDLIDRSQMRELLNSYCRQIQDYLSGQSGEGPDTLVWIGSQVNIRNNTDQIEETYSIVLPTDLDPYAGRISFMSPLGQRLLLTRAGHTAEIQSPEGKYELLVKDMSYEHEHKEERL